MNIKPENLGDAISEYLSNYTEEVTEDIFQGVEKIANEVNAEIKSRISFKQPTGKYVKAFRIKETFRDKRNRRMTWYVAAPHYRLTHLLEFGHAKASGGRTKAYKHIVYGEDIAEKKMNMLVERAVKR